MSSEAGMSSRMANLMFWSRRMIGKIERPLRDRRYFLDEEIADFKALFSDCDSADVPMVPEFQFVRETLRNCERNAIPTEEDFNSLLDDGTPEEVKRIKAQKLSNFFRILESECDRAYRRLLYSAT